MNAATMPNGITIGNSWQLLRWDRGCGKVSGSACLKIGQERLAELFSLNSFPENPYRTNLRKRVNCGKVAAFKQAVRKLDRDKDQCRNPCDFSEQFSFFSKIKRIRVSCKFISSHKTISFRRKWHLGIFACFLFCLIFFFFLGNR